MASKKYDPVPAGSYLGDIHYTGCKYCKGGVMVADEGYKTHMEQEHPGQPYLLPKLIRAPPARKMTEAEILRRNARMRKMLGLS